MKEMLLNLATVVLVLCAAVVTGLVVRREFFTEPAHAADEVRQVEEWERLAATGHVLGPENAPVKIIEFSDFQCPYCAKAHVVLEEIRAEYSERVAVVYRHFPLSMHEHAFEAALASECAAAQGRFEAYHDLLFEKQDLLGAKSWASYAKEADLPDLERFRACIKEERFTGRVERDIHAAERIGVSGTPTFIIEGKLRSGAPTVVQVERWVQEALSDT